MGPGNNAQTRVHAQTHQVQQKRTNKNMQGRQVHDRLRATTFADRTGRERRHIGKGEKTYRKNL